MKFVKGVIFGTVLSAGLMMIYNETAKNGKNIVMKKGKKIMKNMGMM